MTRPLAAARRSARGSRQWRVQVRPEGERLKGGFALVRLGKKARESRENWISCRGRNAHADPGRARQRPLDRRHHHGPRHGRNWRTRRRPACGATGAAGGSRATPVLPTTMPERTPGLIGGSAEHAMNVAFSSRGLCRADAPAAGASRVRAGSVRHPPKCRTAHPSRHISVSSFGYCGHADRAPTHSLTRTRTHSGRRTGTALRAHSETRDLAARSFTGACLPSPPSRPGAGLQTGIDGSAQGWKKDTSRAT